MKILMQFLLASILLFPSCNTTEEKSQKTQETQEVQPPKPKQETIVGKWKVTKNEVGGENILNNDAIIFSFKPNGSFILTKNNEKSIGEWSVYEDNSLVISFFDDNTKTIQGQYEIAKSRLSITGTTDGNATLIELIKSKNMGQ